jgi:hypothetical protein
MIKIRTLLLSGFLFLLTGLAQAGHIDVSPYGTVLTGDGLTVEMAPLTQVNKDGLHDVLMRIKGAPAVEAGIDGKVLLYTAAHGGTGIDFQFERDGEMHNRMSSRNPWGDWTTVEVYFGSNTYHVENREALSRDLKTKDLASAYGRN